MAMGDWGEIPVFGPDASTGLIPLPRTLAHYAVFFAFGALLYRRPKREGGLLVETLGRWWMVLLLSVRSLSSRWRCTSRSTPTPYRGRRWRCWR